MTANPINSMLQGMPLPAVVVGRSERLLHSNPQAIELLGPNINGRHFITILRQPGLLDAIEACFRDGAPRKTEFLTSQDGQNVTFNVTIARIDLPDQHGVLVCFEDVTHLQKAEQMRRDFVANVSHELRTPLTALLGFIETLRGPARNDPPAQDRFLATMEREAGRMNRLVGDLLSLSRVEADERIRPTGQTNLSALLRSVAHSLSPLADEQEARIIIALPETDVMISADEDQIRQVLTNLLENAVKYGGRAVDISLSLSDPMYEPALRAYGIRIVVRDTGPGIDPVHIPRLTERFYRVDNHRSREVGGTGLGLAIVKHIVNRHRGRLRITSKRGDGTEFTIILPA